MDVNIRLLPDRSGRVRICWFIRDEKGFAGTGDGSSAPIETKGGTIGRGPSMIHIEGVQGRIACRPTLMSMQPQVVAGAYQPLVHSDDARAATCPECLATNAYAAQMQRYKDYEAGLLSA